MFNKLITMLQARHLALLVYVSGFFLYGMIPQVRSAEHVSSFLWLHTIHALSGIIFHRLYSPKASTLVLTIVFFTSRIAMIGIYPWLSDDVFGYLFYGKATLHGENLYAITADNPSLTYLRDAAYDLMAFKPHQNIYPPIATIFMTFSAWISSEISTSIEHGILIWKSLLFFCEGLGLWILFLALHKRGLSFAPIIMYLSIPLTAIEGIGQAHNELLLLPFLGLIMIIAIDSTIRFREIFLGGLCAVIGMIKIYPIVLLIPIMITGMNRKQIFITILSCIVVILISAMPWFSGIFIGDMSALVGYTTVLTFYNGTYFNGVALYFYRWILEAFQVHDWWLIAPKAVSLTRGLAIIAASIFSKVQHHGVLFSMYVILTIAVCISPKVHVWYLIPIIYTGSIQAQKSLPIISTIMMLTYAMYVVDPPMENIPFEITLWVLMGLTLYLDHKGLLHIFNRDQSKVLA